MMRSVIAGRQVGIPSTMTEFEILVPTEVLDDPAVEMLIVRLKKERYYNRETFFMGGGIVFHLPAHEAVLLKTFGGVDYHEPRYYPLS